MKKTLLLLPGDGIGPEVIAEARRIAPMVVEYVEADTGPHTLFSFEPDATTLFESLLPRYVATRIFSALLEAAGLAIAVSNARMVALTKRRTRSGLFWIVSSWLWICSPTAFTPKAA